MPNGYTVNVANKALAQDLAPFPGIDAGIKAVESAGPDSSRIALVCSFWYDFCIAQDPRRLGIDVANKKVTMFDDGKTRINVSTLPQCGRAVAKLLSLKELPEDESDTSPTISKWRNQPLYISSCLVSQRDILDSINRVKGITNTDWQIEYQTSESRYKQGLEKIQAGDYMTGMGYVLYGRTFYPNGDGNYENIPGLANGTLGLPEEDIDEATRLGLAAIESGQDLFTAK